MTKPHKRHKAEKFFVLMTEPAAPASTAPASSAPAARPRRRTATALAAAAARRGTGAT